MDGISGGTWVMLAIFGGFLYWNHSKGKARVQRSRDYDDAWRIIRNWEAKLAGDPSREAESLRNAIVRFKDDDRRGLDDFEKQDDFEKHRELVGNRAGHVVAGFDRWAKRVDGGRPA